MNGDRPIRSSASARPRTSEPDVTVAFAQGPEADRLLHDLARALARRAARHLRALPPEASGADAGTMAGDD